MWPRLAWRAVVVILVHQILVFSDGAAVSVDGAALSVDGTAGEVRPHECRIWDGQTVMKVRTIQPTKRDLRWHREENGEDDRGAWWLR